VKRGCFVSQSGVLTATVGPLNMSLDYPADYEAESGSAAHSDQFSVNILDCALASYRVTHEC
jgi:hypothetical protein